jgi:hypothetical protein
MSRLSHTTKFLLAAAVAAAVATSALARIPADSEIAPQEKRRPAVEKAAEIAKQVRPAPLPKNLILPFSPPNFDLTDEEEAAAAAAAARRANPGAVSSLPSDHQLLSEIIAKVKPSGTMTAPNGRQLLMFGKRFVKIGTHFTVTYKGSDYDLELTDIDATNFTLRYKSETITRPIKPGQ